MSRHQRALWAAPHAPGGNPKPPDRPLLVQRPEMHIAAPCSKYRTRRSAPNRPRPGPLPPEDHAFWNPPRSAPAGRQAVEGVALASASRPRPGPLAHQIQHISAGDAARGPAHRTSRRNERARKSRQGVSEAAGSTDPCTPRPRVLIRQRCGGGRARTHQQGLTLPVGSARLPRPRRLP